VCKVLEDMSRWMEEHEYESVEQLKGSMSHRSCAEPAAFERANYIRVLDSYKVVEHYRAGKPIPA
jgi:dihydroorotate dehydrogenase (fumarate)